MGREEIGGFTPPNLLSLSFTQFVTMPPKKEGEKGEKKDKKSKKQRMLEEKQRCSQTSTHIALPYRTSVAQGV